jgi:hypothetical protein
LGFEVGARHPQSACGFDATVEGNFLDYNQDLEYAQDNNWANELMRSSPEEGLQTGAGEYFLHNDLICASNLGTPVIGSSTSLPPSYSNDM